MISQVLKLKTNAVCVKRRCCDVKVTSLKEEDFTNAIGPDWRTSLGPGRRRQRWKNVRRIPCLIVSSESNRNSANMKCLYQAGVGTAMIFTCAAILVYFFFQMSVPSWCYMGIKQHFLWHHTIHVFSAPRQRPTKLDFSGWDAQGDLKGQLWGNFLGSGPGCSCSRKILPKILTHNLIQPIYIYNIYINIIRTCLCAWFYMIYRSSWKGKSRYLANEMGIFSTFDSFFEEDPYQQNSGTDFGDTWWYLI